MKKRSIALIVALVLLIGCIAGGTIAWLIDDTQELENTFSVGDVNIDLDETDPDQDYPFVPGDEITKDPTITVWESVESYVFVKIVVEGNNVPTTVDGGLDPVLTWAIADGWTYYDHSGETTEASSSDGTYYFYMTKEAVAAATKETGTTIPVLKDNKVCASEDITKAMAEHLQLNKPTITVSAAIVQLKNIENVATAFESLDPAFTGLTSSEGGEG